MQIREKALEKKSIQEYKEKFPSHQNYKLNSSFQEPPAVDHFHIYDQQPEPLIQSLGDTHLNPSTTLQVPTMTEIDIGPASVRPKYRKSGTKFLSPQPNSSIQDDKSHRSFRTNVTRKKRPTKPQKKEPEAVPLTKITRRRSDASKISGGISDLDKRTLNLVVENQVQNAPAVTKILLVSPSEAVATHQKNNFSLNGSPVKGKGTRKRGKA